MSPQGYGMPRSPESQEEHHEQQAAGARPCRRPMRGNGEETQRRLVTPCQRPTKGNGEDMQLEFYHVSMLASIDFLKSQCRQALIFSKAWRHSALTTPVFGAHPVSRIAKSR